MLTITDSGKQAIQTRYHGATNTKPSRVSARTGGGQFVQWMNYDSEVNDSVNHADVAMMLAKSLNWEGRMAQGGLGNGYVFVFVD